MRATRTNTKKYGQIKKNPDEYYRTPKRKLLGVSGYLLFSSDQRRKRLPDKITVTELGHMWSNLNDKEKTKYNEKAEKLRNIIYDAEDKKLQQREKEKEKERFAENELRLTSSLRKVPKRLEIDYYEDLFKYDEDKGFKRDFEQGKTADIVNENENLGDIDPLYISTGDYDDKDDRNQDEKMQKEKSKEPKKSRKESGKGKSDKEDEKKKV
jgi:hypothetical protein